MTQSVEAAGIRTAMTPSPKTIDDYLAPLDADTRGALQHLRESIRSAAPEAEECISYQMPAFRLNGMLVGFAAHARHCALYAWNGTTVEAFADELKDFDTSKGTIRFTPDKPLPETLVRRLVEMKVARNAEKAKAAKSRTGPQP